MSMEQDLERAWELLEQGDVGGARRLAGKVRTDDPGAPEVLLLEAACAREEGDTDAALALLEQASAADPEWPTPVLWSAELLASDPERMRDALERATRALELADEEDEYLEAVALKAGLELDLGKLQAARRTLEELPPATSGSDVTPLLALEFAHLHLGAEQPEEARRRFQALVDADPGMADAWYGLGLAADALDDDDDKRRAWLRALELDEAAPLDDARLGEGEMAEVAEAALGELPPRARALVENVPILIADLPSKADVERGLDPRLLGLFDGTPYPESSSVGGAPQLTRILLFRKNLERVAPDEETLREEIRTTLLHESGHFFGMSEEDLEKVGLD